jgi:hypothetical protein
LCPSHDFAVRVAIRGSPLPDATTSLASSPPVLAHLSDAEAVDTKATALSPIVPSLSQCPGTVCEFAGICFNFDAGETDPNFVLI